MNGASQPAGEGTIARVVHRARRSDLLFAGLGVVVLVIALAILFALIGDLFIRGAERLSWDFFTNFPSRRPERAGILSAWVGTVYVMIATAAVARGART